MITEGLKIATISDAKLLEEIDAAENDSRLSGLSREAAYRLKERNEFIVSLLEDAKALTEAIQEEMKWI